MSGQVSSCYRNDSKRYHLYLSPPSTGPGGRAGYGRKPYEANLFSIMLATPFSPFLLLFLSLFLLCVAFICRIRFICKRYCLGAFSAIFYVTH